VLAAIQIGLMAPELTELLPNPAGPGNDSSDEIIEDYNPTNVVFNLSGYGLQAGTTSLHNFTFPSGINLPAHSFTAFYSADTSLGLSNSGGQVKLLDPFGNSISATGVYDTAKDGQAWALAMGKWYWTTNPTPARANVINQPAAGKKSTGKKSSQTKKTSTIKYAVTSASTSSSGQDSGAASVTPIHLWTLAIVGSLALLYGAYEYRADLANRIYQLRQYFRTRRADGS
jgi:hypothetical protein